MKGSPRHGESMSLPACLKGVPLCLWWPGWLFLVAERFPACFCRKAGVVSAVWLRGRREMLLQALDCHLLAVVCFVQKICALASQIKSMRGKLQTSTMTYFNELSFVHILTP